MLVPLALAQFIASFAGSNMNVAITSIAKDLNTDVSGVQTAITLFLLTMAALMIPGSKLTDIWGRKFCFQLGLIIYGLGALIAALAPVLGVLIVGYSLFEGIGSALMIPPIYILLTVASSSVTERAKSFGVVSAAGGIGASAGPLIGGLITTYILWRASFLLQVLVVAGIIVLGRRIYDPGVQGPKPRFDLLGAILSAVGLLTIVVGILATRRYGWVTAKQPVSIGGTQVIPQGGISPFWLFVVAGGLILAWFFLHLRNLERAHKQPLVATRLFRNRTSNLGLVTQMVQWLLLLGSSFTVSVFLQSVRGYNAIETGLIVTPTTIGILITGSLAQRFAQRRSQRTLIEIGFVACTVGLVLLVLFARATSSIALTYLPALFIFGLGAGIMLTSSVNIVQSAFPDKDQGEISGVSRSVSNLGSTLGTAIAGSIVVAEILAGNKDYALSLVLLAVFSVLGLVASVLLPAGKPAGKPSVRERPAQGDFGPAAPAS
jgi:MFS family permease